MRSALAALVLVISAALPAYGQTPPPLSAPPAPATPPTPPPPASSAPAAPPTAPAPSPPPTPVVSGPTLSLEQAIAIALEGQPQIRQRLALYAAARYRVDQSFSALLPQLSGTVSTTRAQSVSTSTSTTGGTSVQTVQRDFGQTLLGQVSLSQLLFDFGKNFATVDAVRKNADVALEDTELQRQLIALTVKQSFTNMNFAQRLIRVQQQALERSQLNLRSARGFFEVGTQPKSAVTRAEVDVANAQVAIIQARNQLELARVALNTAMGIAVNTPTQVVDNLIYEPVTLDRAELQAEAIRQRPEYRQAKLQMDASGLTLRRTQLDFFPDITGTGAYGGTRTDLLPEWSATFNLTWQLFDGGNRIARYKEAKANVTAARENLRGVELGIQRDVEQAILAVDADRESIQAAQKAVESAQENFRLAQGRFDAGVGTILELTDAQLALTQAQNTEAQALANYRNDLAAVERAVGRR
jgi:outer membrane protein